MIQRKILFGIFVAGILISYASLAEATLWDLLISVDVVNAPILSNNPPIIEGWVYDHAGKSISNAEVQIRLGSETVLKKTDSEGKFYHNFENIRLSSGIHLITIKAVSEDQRIGFTEKTFQIKGPIRISGNSGQILSTPEAIKYLQSSPLDFENNPIGMKLYQYYQNLKEKLQEEEKRQLAIEEKHQQIDEQRRISENLTSQTIEEFNPGVGIFTGWRYDNFVDNLDKSIKGIIVKQLNHTVSALKEAQQAMRQVLKEGGTQEEARQAYFEKVAISQEMMSQISREKNYTRLMVNSTYSEEVTLEKDLKIQNSTQVNEDAQIDINGTKIEVGMSGTIIYLNVNGTLIEFLVNGTQIIPITNSSQK